jgi:hypothetical protein
METTGSAYLYALAQIAITFAGFTALFMMLRQTFGGTTTKYDLFVTRNYLFFSFLVVIGSMVPSLLAAFGIAQDLIWRLSSLAVAIPMGVFVVTYPSRRRRLVGAGFPLRVWPMQLILASAAIVLFFNGVAASNAGRFELGVTLILLGSFYAILLTLGIMFEAQSQHRDRTPDKQ